MENTLLQQYLKLLKVRLTIAKIVWWLCLVMFSLSVLALFFAHPYSTAVTQDPIALVRLILYGLPLLLITKDKKALILKDSQKQKKELVAKAALKLIEDAESEKVRLENVAADELKQYIDKKN
jgi:hypothetical protein